MTDTEILAAMGDGNFYAWKVNLVGHSFSLLDSFPKKIGKSIASYPVITDMENDGDVDIAIGSDLGFFVFNLDAPLDSSRTEWPMLQHDVWRTGNYEFKVPEVSIKTFIRGDSNSDGEVDISDIVFILLYLFRGDVTPSCLDAADADDSGRIELTDAIYLLNSLFKGGAAPRTPFPETGFDPTEDSLNCL